MLPNSRIKCLIVEDEPLAQDLLTDYIERIQTLELAGIAGNAQQALLICQQQKPDLLFLDIRMPRLNGFDLLQQLAKPLPLVVVITAYEQYALEGYEHALVDYLLKPVDFDRFNAAVTRVEERLEVRRDLWQSDYQSEAEATKKMLTLRVDRSRMNIPLKEIRYIEALDNYVKIHLPGKKPHLSKIAIYKIEHALPPADFVRINRKYIVRVDQVQQLASNALTLFGGEELPLGVTYRETVHSVLANNFT